MSAIDRFLTPIDAAFLGRRKRDRQRIDARNDIHFAMRYPDELVIEMTYTDAAGIRTRRVVSPIRNGTGKKFLAMCLCRARPQWFMFSQCSDVELKLASDYVMPVPIIELSFVGSKDHDSRID